MDEKLAAGIISGGVSLLIWVLGYFLGPRGQRSLESWKAKLMAENDSTKADLQARTDSLRNDFLERLEGKKNALANLNSSAAARRDYEYEALKRLYTQVEPILFQLYEALEEAHYRVRSLARSSRSGNLGSGVRSWVAGEGYYLKTTIYKLILPACYLRIMQHKITFVDLSLDPSVRLRYLLLKLYSRSMTDDFIFAELLPTLAYEPNAEGWQVLRQERPQVYWRQGLVVGTLENVADALIRKDGEVERAATYAEFEAMLTDREQRNNSIQELIELFRGFSPSEKPVLARMVVAQAYLGQLIISTYHQESDPDSLALRFEIMSRDSQLRDVLAWEKDNSIGAGRLEPQAVVLYIATRLRWLRNDEGWLKADDPTNAAASCPGGEKLSNG